MHNLFGDTHAVNIELIPDSTDYRIVKIQHGDTVDDMLRYVHYDSEKLMQIFQRKIAGASLSENQQLICLNTLRAGLAGYTYLEE